MCSTCTCIAITLRENRRRKTPPCTPITPGILRIVRSNTDLGCWPILRRVSTLSCVLVCLWQQLPEDLSKRIRSAWNFERLSVQRARSATIWHVACRKMIAVGAMVQRRLELKLGKVHDWKRFCLMSSVDLICKLNLLVQRSIAKCLFFFCAQPENKQWSVPGMFDGSLDEMSRLRLDLKVKTFPGMKGNGELFLNLEELWGFTSQIQNLWNKKFRGGNPDGRGNGNCPCSSLRNPTFPV